MDMEFDVVVVGAGNAGLCAALTAARNVERVLLFERAPTEFRGGNTTYTRDLRYAHDRDAYTSGQYTEDEFFDDIQRVTREKSNPELAKLVAVESRGLPDWMTDFGVKWQKPMRGSLHLSRTNRFFVGGGKALVNTYFNAANRLGVNICYGATVEDLVIDGDKCTGLIVRISGKETTVRGKSIVIASGGFEANIDWLRQYWGSAVDNFIVRGTRHNDGLVLRRILDKGVKPAGEPGDAHMIGVDARSPKYDGGIVTRVDTIPLGIVLNKFAKRFYDEGEDEWPKRYAIWGRLIAQQPDQIAYSIFDSKVVGKFIPPAYEAYMASSIDRLANLINLDPNMTVAAVNEYNEHIEKGGTFNLGALDNCRTLGLDPPKSHWALLIDTPPFHCYPLRPGITFTYGGVAVNRKAQVLADDGHPLANLFAAGEIMSGNILTRGYLGGTGLTIGAVFGRIAGEEASKNV